jgi:hypothetical protein
LQALENSNESVLTPLRQLEEKLKQQHNEWSAKQEELLEQAQAYKGSYDIVNAYTRELKR